MPDLLILLAEFPDSWQYRKIAALYSTHLAQRATATICRMANHFRAHGPRTPIEHKAALRMVEASNPRDRPKVLVALKQANVLRQTPAGYTFWGMAEEPNRPGRAQPTAQLALALKQPALPAPVALGQAEASAAVEEFEQNQEVSLARAGAMSATQPEKTASIEEPRIHTDFLQARTKTAAQAGCLLGERSEAGLQSFAFKRAQAKKQPLQPEGQSFKQPPPPDSRPRAVSVAAAPLGGQGVRLVARANVSPSRFEDVRYPARRVKRQDVAGQQNDLNCRKQTSAALAGELRKEHPPMKPSAAEQAFYNVVEESGLFPFPLRPQDVRRWMQQRFTIDEVVSVLLDFQKRKDAGGWEPKYPCLVEKVVMQNRAFLADQDQAQRAARREPATDGKLLHLGGPPKTPSLPKRELVDADPKSATCVAINAHLGAERFSHHIDTAADMAVYVTLLAKTDVDTVVSLYAEKMGVDREERWQEVASDLANGKRPVRLGQKPPPDSGPPPDVRDKLRILGFEIFNVETKQVDKLAHAG